MTLIDAAKARDFVAALAHTQRDPEYQRGAAEACRMFTVYLEALMADPAGDRQVAA